MVHAYICVYKKPLKTSVRKTRKEAEAAGNQALLDFLNEYGEDSCFFDWGDDPAFFASQRFLRDVNRATWGVCRPDIRQKLDQGDLVVFFCAHERQKECRYYYIGFGTVAETIIRRSDIWRKKHLIPFQNFFNVLVDKQNGHKEYFYPWHNKGKDKGTNADWAKRAHSPYILFSNAEGHSSFKLTKPLWVATYREGKGAREKWRRKCPTVAKLFKMLQPLIGSRKLRTYNPSYPHEPINLVNKSKTKDPRRMVMSLRRKLIGVY